MSKSTLSKQLKLKKLKPFLPSWWTPVWRGLIADPNGKHRKKMGPAIWVYLYLLLYTKRETGIVYRTQRVIAKDTGYSLRAVQRHIARLRKFNYIATEKLGNGLKIRIKRWKTFGKKT